MAVSYQRPPAGRPPYGRLTPTSRRRRPVRYLVVALLVAIVAAAAAGAIVLRSSHGSLSADSTALARIGLPVGGARIAGVSVVTGPHANAVPVSLRGNQVWPDRPIPAGSQVSIQVTLRRPSSIAWLTGATQRLSLTLTAPTARLAAQYITVSGHAPLRVHFDTPVASVAYGTGRHLTNLTLNGAQTAVTVPHQGVAGSVLVAAAPRGWESATPTLVSWFPAGVRASVVASPAPGTPLSPATPISLTFSRPVSQALGHALPPVSPATAGTWHTVDDHTIVFRPQGTGYGLGAHVTVALPAGVMLANGVRSRSGTLGSWRVPPGSTLRLQQLLAGLGYLPLRFVPDGAPVAMTASAQQTAAVKPPAGHFDWVYGNVPGHLRAMWAPGANGELTRGAVMQFENDHALGTDGVAGPLVWKALIAATLANQHSSFGYSFVDVSKTGQHLMLWHNGRTILTTAVNTGIAQAPTASGTFAVYEHLRVTTMSGTNPDGSHYHDPGIQFVSYFNGGDALHAFTRAQYGFPQSLGCVEMALGPAGQVWPYTPIGTIVNVY